MDSIDHNQFNLPSEFQMPDSLTAVADKDGISTFNYGNQGFAAWRFAVEARPWKAEKVKKYKIEGAESIPVILFYRDKDNVVPIKLRRRMNYEERTNKFGEQYDKAVPMQDAKAPLDLNAWELPVGFDNPVFQSAFEKFKEAGERPGTPISNWRADPGQVNTLSALGIFSVEQLGNYSEQSFKDMLGQLPPSMRGSFDELHELAVAFVNSQSGTVNAEEFGDKIEALESMNERILEELDSKDAEIAALKAKIKGKSKAKAKSKSKAKAKAQDVDVVDGVIQGVE
jgi:hypothetical protein